MANFVNAQNVSIGHLAYEDAIIEKKHSGGKGYCVTDPNPPITYESLYRCLTLLAHPQTPVSFPHVPHMAMLLPSYVMEAYILVRHRYMRFLPSPTRDLLYLQPAIFNLCTLHIVYTDTAAQEEIGYRAPIKTLEGFALAMVDWNTKVEEKAKAKARKDDGHRVHAQDDNAVPKPPNIH